METKEIINRVEASGLITIDLVDYFPKEAILIFDLKDYLFQGLILREKDFREALVQFDWKKYEDRLVSIHCSADAIIPSWAYMLVVAHLEPYAKAILSGEKEQAENILLMKNIQSLDINLFKDQRIVIKGCGEKKIPDSAFVEITRRLKPVVKSILYGEPCSTVPIFKQIKSS